MALGISYSPQFFDGLEDILNYFDGRNGSNRFSKKLLKIQLHFFVIFLL